VLAQRGGAGGEPGGVVEVDDALDADPCLIAVREETGDSVTGQAQIIIRA
jgi:hypothetical protein